MSHVFIKFLSLSNNFDIFLLKFNKIRSSLINWSKQNISLTVAFSIKEFFVRCLAWTFNRRAIAIDFHHFRHNFWLQSFTSLILIKLILSREFYYYFSFIDKSVVQVKTYELPLTNNNFGHTLKRNLICNTVNFFFK